MGYLWSGGSAVPRNAWLDARTRGADKILYYQFIQTMFHHQSEILKLLYIT